MAEARGTFHGHCGLQEIAVLEAVFTLEVIRQRVPFVVGARRGGVGQGGRNEGSLVVTRVVAHLCVELVGIPLHAEAAEELHVMGVETPDPFHACVAHDGVLLGEERTRLILPVSANAGHVVVGYGIERDIVFFVRVGQHVAEVFAERKVTVELEAGLDGDAEHGVLKVVLVLCVTVVKDGQRVTQLPVVVAVSRECFIKVGLIGDVKVVGVNLPARKGVGTEHGRFGVGQE